jgi:hypothetical protein
MDISGLPTLKFTTMDGVEREFRLTMREQRDIANKFGEKLAQTSVATFIPSILYMCLVDKSITEDEFASILQPDEELLIGFYTTLREHCGKSINGNEKYRPTKTPPND